MPGTPLAPPTPGPPVSGSRRIPRDKSRYEVQVAQEAAFVAFKTGQNDELSSLGLEPNLAKLARVIRGSDVQAALDAAEPFADPDGGVDSIDVDQAMENGLIFLLERFGGYLMDEGCLREVDGKRPESPILDIDCVMRTVRSITMWYFVERNPPAEDPENDRPALAFLALRSLCLEQRSEEHSMMKMFTEKLPPFVQIFLRGNRIANESKRFKNASKITSSRNSLYRLLQNSTRAGRRDKGAFRLAKILTSHTACKAFVTVASSPFDTSKKRSDELTTAVSRFLLEFESFSQNMDYSTKVSRSSPMSERERSWSGEAVDMKQLDGDTKKLVGEFRDSKSPGARQGDGENFYAKMFHSIRRAHDLTKPEGGRGFFGLETIERQIALGAYLVLLEMNVWDEVHCRPVGDKLKRR
eukprot:CAMPEP_0114500148 /NCGR_PEP_ID=MMETSP0109-20121206/7803_1 /TAXON_ID=29199 /ORGANISM="Chlorarachnion reptans, Strain CCCM449" /LENGTH=411 /DNA_ID=CAMNT_0001677777 /DNA_START=70 /DNA_END=1305 /DNA_ORIENTATION=+